MSDLQDDVEPIDVLLEEVLRDPRAAFAARSRHTRLRRLISVAAVALLGVGAVIGVAVLRQTGAETPRFAVPPQGKGDVVPKDREEFSRLLRTATAIRFTRKEAIGATHAQNADMLDFDIWPETVTADSTTVWFEALRAALLESKSVPKWAGIDTCLGAEVLLPEGKKIVCFVNLDVNGGEATRTRFGLGGQDLQPLLPNEALQRLLVATNENLEAQHRRALGQANTIAEIAALPATSTRVDCPALPLDQLHRALERLHGLKELRLSAGDKAVKIDDDYAAGLSALPVTGLDLTAADLTDLGIERLAALPRLTSLTLRDGTRALTGTGFARLNKLQLRAVMLQGCSGITKQGMAEIARLPRVESLMLSNVDLGPACALLDTLPSFPQLKFLAIRGGELSDAQMPLLLRTKMEMILLVDAEVTGEGIATLAELPSLSWLRLVGTKLRNDDVAALAKLRNLKILYLQNTSLDADAWSALKEALAPRCRLEGNPLSRLFDTGHAFAERRD